MAEAVPAERGPKGAKKMGKATLAAKEPKKTRELGGARGI